MTVNTPSGRAYGQNMYAIFVHWPLLGIALFWPCFEAAYKYTGHFSQFISCFKYSILYVGI